MYEQEGPLVHKVAEGSEQTLSMFRELQALHQSNWNRKGQGGAFAEPRVVAFHEHMMRSEHVEARVQLAQVTAGSRLLGYLYSFVCDGVVSSYQSAFNFESDARLKPGLVSHLMAIRHAIASGHHTYDLLAGDDRYKRTLSSQSGELVWMSVANRTWRARAYFGVRRARRALLTGTSYQP